MSMIQTNATLLTVHAAASGESFDGPAGEGAEMWVGETEAYARESRIEIPTPSGVDVVMVPELIVQTGDPDVEWLHGLLVRWRRDPGGEEFTAKVNVVARRELAGLSAELQTTKLTLAAATVAPAP